MDKSSNTQYTPSMVKAMKKGCRLTYTDSSRMLSVTESNGQALLDVSIDDIIQVTRYMNMLILNLKNESNKHYITFGNAFNSKRIMGDDYSGFMSHAKLLSEWTNLLKQKGVRVRTRTYIGFYLKSAAIMALIALFGFILLVVVVGITKS